MFIQFINKFLSYLPKVTISYNTTESIGLTEEEPTGYEPPSYEDMTKKELVAYAEEQGITLKMKMTKADMLFILRNHC